MKNINNLLVLTALIMCNIIFAQKPALKVGDNPATMNTSAALDVESTTKGFLPPRMTTTERNAITSPAKGLIVYDTDLDCVLVNKGTPSTPAWECIGASAGPSVSANCTTAGFNAGTYISGTPLSGRTYTVTLTNNSFASATIAFSAADLTLSDPSLSAGTPTGSPALSGGNATLASGASVVITYPVTGTPSACGTLSGIWTKLSLNCTKTIFVSPSNFILPSTSVTYNSLGEVSGFTANWTAQAGVTGYTVEHSTTESGPWTAFPSNPYTGTSAAISGLSGNYAYWVKVTLVGGSCAGGSSTTLVGCAAKVDATTWKVLMCHNLGADPTLDPHTPGIGIHGAMIQWGRRGPNTTGDSRIDWQTAGNTTMFTAAPTSGNNNNPAIAGWNTSPAANLSWRDASGNKTANDPCPSGFRLPTNTEHIAISNNNTKTTTGTFNNTLTNFGAAVHYTGGYGVISLTYPAAGVRSQSDGSAFNRALEASIWSSTEGGGDSSYNRQTNTSSDPNLVWNNGGISNRILGVNVRCIKE